MISLPQKKRTFYIFALFCILYSIIIFNLFYLQIKKHSFFVSLAQKQYKVSLTRMPARASIVDRHGTPLALNKDHISAFIVPNQITHDAQLNSFLLKHFPDAYYRLIKQTKNKFMFIKRRLSQEEIALIQSAQLPDLHLLTEPSRFYPLPEAGTITGITSIDNKGLFGIEFFYNETLSGTPSSYKLEKDARSGYYYFTKETTIKGTEGTAIQLTIDSDLQYLACKEIEKTVKKFNAQEGAALVVNPENGEILVMAMAPKFDPNHTEHINIADTKNRSITEAYELGSVFKVFTALAALEENVVHPDELVDCHNKTTTYIDGRRINTWKAQGIIPFSEVIETSNNIGIAIVAKRLNNILYEHLCRLGFGKKTNIPLPGEQAGFVNPPHNWSKQSIISLSYGYEVTATLLQLAHAFCIIANKGHEIPMQLIMGQQQTNNPKPLLYSPESIAAIESILNNTTLHGTTKRAAIKGYTVMSKTGTANLLENGVYNPQKNIYTCAGIIQKGNYKRVIITFVKEAAQPNLYASQVSAPLFERIAEKVLIHDKVL